MIRPDVSMDTNSLFNSQAVVSKTPRADQPALNKNDIRNWKSNSQALKALKERNTVF